MGLKTKIMIQANELRIGNWVTYNPESVDDGTSIIPLAVSCIDEEVGVILRDGFTNCYLFNEILPIPLTPEILEKCGFSNLEYENYWVHSNWYNISLKYDSGTWGLRHNFKNIITTNIDSLHQLQNLYWCLCWEELIVNL